MDIKELEKEEKILAERLMGNPLDGVAGARWFEVQKELAKFPVELRTSPFLVEG